MRPQLQRYRRSLGYSYAFGDFAALELLRHRAERARWLFVHSALPAERRDPLEDLARRRGVPLSQDDDLVARLVHKGTVQVVGVFDKYEMELSPSADHLLLVQPGDPGNLGTILRTAAAFGVTDVALVGEGLDPFNPHVVRASVGACFLVSSAVFPDLETYRRTYRHRLYPFSKDAGTPLSDAAFEPPYVLVFGPEWPGLPEDCRRMASSVHIPQAASVESLALPSAVAIALYEIARRRPKGLLGAKK